jgi:photosystem II stability/assembly factor-like uncharacterized protein
VRPDRARRRLIVGGSVAAMLAVAGCANQSHAPILFAPAGSASLLSTPSGIIWSFRQDGQGDGMWRSADHGTHWRVVLPGQGPGSGLVASYFLGAGTAWTIRAATGGHGGAIMFGTKDGGTIWWHAAIPGSAPRAGYTPRYEIYFANTEYGWVLASGTSRGRRLKHGWAAREKIQLWSTTDGGRAWSREPGPLPLQGRRLGNSREAGGCAVQPAIAFANPLTGWLTEGTCHAGLAAPVIWRTADGGRTWSRVALAQPPGGFGKWRAGHGHHARAGAMVVGPPRVVQSGVHALVLVPLALARGRLVIEQSRDGGVSWTVATRLHTGVAAAPRQWPCWFDPIGSKQWIVSVPGKLFETFNGGQTWKTRPMSSRSAGPVSFTNLGHGYMQGRGPVVALRTDNGGRSWRVENNGGMQG